MSDDDPTCSDQPDVDQSGPADDDPTDAEHAKRLNNTAENRQTSLDDTVDIKEQWVGMTVYLPPALRDELELGFREYSYECKRNGGIDLKKLRHFYPLVVALGLEQLKNTDVEDLVPLLSYISAEYR